MNSRAGALFDRFTSAVASGSLGLVFVLFIYGVGMRYLFDRPVSWVDEAVTVLTVWSILWTCAFRLRWTEYIAFDVVFINLSERAQRFMLVTVLVLFVALMLAALPGLIDYTLFLWRERTDMLGIRLDIVYAIFPFYFAVVVLRMLVCIARLAGANWRAELRSWSNDSQADTP